MVRESIEFVVGHDREVGEAIKKRMVKTEE